MGKMGGFRSGRTGAGAGTIPYRHFPQKPATHFKFREPIGVKPLIRHIPTSRMSPLAVLFRRRRDYAVKGPSGRLKHDVRRVWECPICGRHERTGGQVVNRACPCHPDTDPPRIVWMRLVEHKSQKNKNEPPKEAQPDASP
jgi:hypothetical protein